MKALGASSDCWVLLAQNSCCWRLWSRNRVRTGHCIARCLAADFRICAGAQLFVLLIILGLAAVITLWQRVSAPPGFALRSGRRFCEANDADHRMFWRIVRRLLTANYARLFVICWRLGAGAEVDVGAAESAD